MDVSVKSFPVGYPFINVISGHDFEIAASTSFFKTQSYIVGQAVNHWDLKMSFVKRALVIQVQPKAIPLLFKMPASDLSRSVFPLSDVQPKLTGVLEDFVNSPVSSIGVLKKLEAYFSKSLILEEIDPRLTYALDLIVAQGGQIRIPQLCEAVNLSQRRVQQLFNHYFGVSAKNYSRIIRLQHFTYSVLSGANFERLIPDGYYDQAHFIHDVKEQTGMSPLEYLHYISDPIRKPAYIQSNIYFQQS